MANKKLAGVLIVLGVVGFLALFPVMMYGTTVNASETTIQLDVSSSGSGSISLSQPGTFSASIVDVSSSPKAISAYEYVAAKMGGLASAQDGGAAGAGENIVSIQISLELKTPSGQVLEFSFNPRELEGTGLKNVTILMGPDELNNETGTFEITITITVRVTAPVVGTVVDLNLSPVTRSFDVPA